MKLTQLKKTTCLTISISIKSRLSAVNSFQIFQALYNYHWMEYGIPPIDGGKWMQILNVSNYHQIVVHQGFIEPTNILMVCERWFKWFNKSKIDRKGAARKQKHHNIRCSRSNHQNSKHELLCTVYPFSTETRWLELRRVRNCL